MNFSQIDQIKRQIITLYQDDFRKIDSSGRLSAMYHAIPAQLAKDKKKYRISAAVGKTNNIKSEELLYELIDSKTVLPYYNTTDPGVSLTDTKDFDSYKMYLSDIGLFVTLMKAALVVYGGLAYLGATAAELTGTQLFSQSEYLIFVTEALMGHTGLLLLGTVIGKAGRRNLKAA